MFVYIYIYMYTYIHKWYQHKNCVFIRLNVSSSFYIIYTQTYLYIINMVISRHVGQTVSKVVKM